LPWFWTREGLQVGAAQSSMSRQRGSFGAVQWQTQSRPGYETDDGDPEPQRASYSQLRHFEGLSVRGGESPISLTARRTRRYIASRRSESRTARTIPWRGYSTRTRWSDRFRCLASARPIATALTACGRHTPVDGGRPPEANVGTGGSVSRTLFTYPRPAGPLR
jgi:hypothetical protein